MNAIAVSNPSPGKVSFPFWPAGQPRLCLRLERCGDKLLVRGFDPDGDAQVFVAELYPDQNDAFLAAVRDAVPLRPTDKRPANDNVVVITGPGPKEPGPQAEVMAAPEIVMRTYVLDVPREETTGSAPLRP